jgi:cobalt/nickel transport system permease protein
MTAISFGPSRGRSGALERTLSGITEALESSLFAEEISTRPGLFQSLDARVKLVLVLVFLISVGLSRNLPTIIAIYCLVLILGWRSAIPPSLLVKRVWLALPFFTGLMILPAIFMTPGPALVRLPLGLVITRTGTISALLLLLRVSTSLSLTLLLILTTPWNTLLSALGVLRVPDVFVLMLGMTYRYTYLLLRVTSDMFLSRKSRVVGRLSVADSQQILASVAGALLAKSLDLSSAVYLAMQSRGFRGTILTLTPFRLQRKDWFWSAVLGSLAALSVVLGR